ncbi:MAG: hypothetical protein Q9226_006969 [Calogaya cf. arnoldii]
MSKSERPSDTSFRKTWDRAEYAQKAAERESHAKEEGKARAEAKAQGRKYYPRASTPPDAKETVSRAARLDVSANVGKTMLVPAGAICRPFEFEAASFQYGTEWGGEEGDCRGGEGEVGVVGAEEEGGGRGGGEGG